MNIRTLTALLALVATAVPCLADGSISLRREATLPPGPVHLGDIADLQGPDALALADVAVSGAVPRSGVRITLEEVSQALSARQNVNLGKLTFHGSACIVSPTAPPSVANSEPAAPVATSQGPRVRDLIPLRISELLSVEPDKLRIKFDDADRKLLDQPSTGRVVELKPLGAADRMPLQLSIYENRSGQGHTLVASGTVRIGVEVLRDVVVCKTTLKKSEVVTVEATTLDQQWLGLASKPASTDLAIGSIVRAGKLSPGQSIMEADIEQAIAIKRGQLCSIHVVSGSFVVKTQARALEAGKVGDTIKFAPANARDKKDARGFEARIEAPGRAIMTVSGEVQSGKEVAHR